MRASTRSLVVALCVVVATLFAGVAWSVSSPVGSSPDEDFHMASMWCPPPLETSGCPVVTEDGRTVGVYLPEYIARPNCFAFHPRRTGACQDALSRTMLVVTKRVDNGNYPGPYYRFAHFFVTGDPETSVVGLRLFNLAACVGMVGAAITLCPRRLRPAIGWALVASIVPMGMFLVPSINPSSWAFTGITTFWIAGIAMARAVNRRVFGLSTLLAASGAVMAAMARNDSIISLLLAVAAGIVLFGTWRVLSVVRVWPRRTIGWGLMVIVTLGVAIWSYASSSSSSGIAASPERAVRDPLQIFTNNMFDILATPAGLLGAANLGWSDTYMGQSVTFSTIAVAGFVFMAGLADLSVRKILALLGIGASFLLLPIYMLQQAMAYMGDQVQPRYFLPLFPLLMAVALVRSDVRGSVNILRGSAVLAWALLVFAHTIAFLTQVRRYAIGLYGPFWPDALPGWRFNTPLTAGGVWIMGSVAFAIATFVLVWTARPSHPEPLADAPLGRRRS